MTNSTQEYLVRQKAFFDELEKLGAVGLIGRLVTGLMSKSPIAKELFGKASRFATQYATNLGREGFRQSGKVFQEGMTALKSTTGKSTIRPMLGTSKQVMGIRESSKIPFMKDPIRSVGQSVLRGAANLVNTGKTIAKEGVGSYLKKDLARTQYFTKTITGEGGKAFDVLAKRSLPGRLINPVVDTGIGFGGLALATNKYDAQGRKRGLASRIGGAAKEGILWGPLRPLAMAHMTTVELPKMTKDIIKGF